MLNPLKFLWHEQLSKIVAPPSVGQYQAPTEFLLHSLISYRYLCKVPVVCCLFEESENTSASFTGTLTKQEGWGHSLGFPKLIVIVCLPVPPT